MGPQHRAGFAAWTGSLLGFRDQDGLLQESLERVLFAGTLFVAAGPADGVAFPGELSLP